MWATVDPDAASGHLGVCICGLWKKKREAAEGMEKQEEADKWHWTKAKPSAVEELVNSILWTLHFLLWNEKKMWSKGGFLPVQQQPKGKREH